MSLHYTILSHTEAGGHPVNEDLFKVEDRGEYLLCTLADGQGGQHGGGLAARLACEAVFEHARKIPAEQLCKPATWIGLLRQADDLVYQSELAGMTGLIGLSVNGDKLVGASNGDSAVIVFQPDGRSHEVTQDQLKNPPVGSGIAACQPFSLVLIPPWKMLVMSDGVWKYVGVDRVRTITRAEKGAAVISALREAAKLPGTGGLQDDFTVVIIEQAEGDATGLKRRKTEKA